MEKYVTVKESELNELMDLTELLLEVVEEQKDDETTIKLNSMVERLREAIPNAEGAEEIDGDNIQEVDIERDN